MLTLENYVTFLYISFHIYKTEIQQYLYHSITVEVRIKLDNSCKTLSTVPGTWAKTKFDNLLFYTTQNHSILS